MPAFLTFGRILFAVLFIYWGATKLFGVQATVDYMAGKVIIPPLLDPYVKQLSDLSGFAGPQMLAITTGIVELFCGLMVAINFGARVFAIPLIILVLAKTYYFDDFWSAATPDSAKLIIDALKNLSIVGALFMIMGHGRQSQSMDATYTDV